VCHQKARRNFVALEKEAWHLLELFDPPQRIEAERIEAMTTAQQLEAVQVVAGHYRTLRLALSIELSSQIDV
jgi:hypothetical protein